MTNDLARALLDGLTPECLACRRGSGLWWTHPKTGRRCESLVVVGLNLPGDPEEHHGRHRVACGVCKRIPDGVIRIFYDDTWKSSTSADNDDEDDAEVVGNPNSHEGIEDEGDGNGTL